MKLSERDPRAQRAAGGLCRATAGEAGHDETGHDETGRDDTGHDDTGHDLAGHHEADHDQAGHDRECAGARRGLGWLLIVTAALGLLASFVITVDKIELLVDPGFVPGCSLSPVLSCTSVMTSDQASVFGFPNPLIGLIGFAVVLGTGAGLLAGARYRRWYWLGLNLGTLLGVGFCMWLMTQALFEIGALCLWCMLVWAVTIFMFWHITMHNLRHGVLPAPRALVAAVLEFPLVVPVTWCLCVVMLIAVRFWSYWRTFL